MNIPTKEECLEILKRENVPENIIAHASAVSDFSMKIIDLLEKRGIKVNRNLIQAACILHDVKKLSSSHHETEGAEFIESLGFPEVAVLIKKHGLARLNERGFIPETWEEKIVFYSDKRCNGAKVVSVDQRFDYIRQRYKKGNLEHEISFTKKLEKELLGNKNL